MEAVIYCGKCGKQLEVAEFGKGKQTKCVRCGVEVPVPSSKPGISQIRLFCSQCGGRLATPADHAGEEMLCPSCRLSVVLPYLEVPGESKGDTQPLLPALEKGDTHPISAAEEPDRGQTPPLPLPTSDVLKGETRAIEDDEPPALSMPARPLAAEGQTAAKTETRPVSSGPAPKGETRPVMEEAAERHDETPGDAEEVELTDQRSRWMESLLDEFVEKHHGEWRTGDLIELSERLSRIGYRYLDIVALNARLREKKDAYEANTARNIRKLSEQDLLQKFVDDHQGRWSDKDLSILLRQLKALDLWPVKLPVLNRMLEEMRRPWKVKMAANLKRLVKDGLLKEYIQSRRGGWTQEGWKDLMKLIDENGYGPVDSTSVAMALRKELTLCARENLTRLQQDGILADFVAAHKGNWSREDLQELLRKIENDKYAPVVNLGAALDAEREQWAQKNQTAS